MSIYSLFFSLEMTSNEEGLDFACTGYLLAKILHVLFSFSPYSLFIVIGKILSPYEARRGKWALSY